jgi:transcriptional regulator GlxA family with amidase domain
MRRVVFVAVPPVQILDLTGPFEVLARCGGYQVELVCSDGTDVSSSCGLTLGRARDYRKVRGNIDTLVIPGGTGAEDLNCSPAFLRWLAKVSGRARRTCSVCTGAFVLAKAGLLDGRRAVTHWRWCDSLARSFPMVRVERDPIYIQDGPVYTSAGVTAGIDLALALVEDLVLFLRRGGGQSQFSSLLPAQVSARAPVEELQGWMVDHLDERLDVETLAARCRMSPRHFARVFAEEKGVTPARFVEQIRVSAARALLENKQKGLKEVAAKTGFGSLNSMRRSFVRVLGVAPARYAERFQGHGERAPE